MFKGGAKINATCSSRETISVTGLVNPGPRPSVGKLVLSSPSTPFIGYCNTHHSGLKWLR